MGSVSEFSNSVLSVVKPALHVGEQIDGGLGWRAWAGSTGFAGGSTNSGGRGEFGDTAAQPLTSIAGSSSIIARTVKVLLGFIGNLLHGSRASLFFFSGGLHRLAGVVFTLCKLDGVLLARLGVGALLTTQAVRLHSHASQQQASRRQCGDCLCAHHSQHMRHQKNGSHIM